MRTLMGWFGWRLAAGLPLLAAFGLVACGGGSGGGASADPAPVVVVAGAPVIALQPAAVTVDDGGNASFSVGASGNATLTYQWLRNGTAIAGATGDTFTLAAAYADNGARFSATVSNSVGQATSNEAALTVRPLAPTITQQPQAATAQLGATQTFSVSVSGGTAPISYQWQRNGVDIAGATAASYTTPALVADDGGAQWRVLITNPAGTLSSNAAVLTLGSRYGDLTITGAGAADVGVASPYAPTSGGLVQAGGPLCSATCDSYVTLRWGGPNSQIFALLSSNAYPAPGKSPGSDVNGINLSLSLSGIGGYGMVLFCAGEAGCNFAALGITFDASARTLTFVNTTFASLGPGNLPIVLNGTLRY